MSKKELINVLQTQNDAVVEAFLLRQYTLQPGMSTPLLHTIILHGTVVHMEQLRKIYIKSIPVFWSRDMQYAKSLAKWDVYLYMLLMRCKEDFVAFTSCLVEEPLDAALYVCIKVPKQLQLFCTYYLHNPNIGADRANAAVQAIRETRRMACYLVYLQRTHHVLHKDLMSALVRKIRDPVYVVHWALARLEQQGEVKKFD